MQLERDMDASASTLTFQDRQKSRKGPRTGPEDLAEARKVIATYCAVVWSFFGELCDHYVECLTVLGALMSDRAYTRRSLFTKNYCGQIVHAMIDDARGYFSVEVSPLRLQEKGSASYPKSHMGSVCEAVFNQVELNRKNFPKQ